MADTSILDPFSAKPRETAKVNPRDQLGGSMELPNLDFEVEAPLKNMASGVGSILQEAFSLGQEIVGIQPENKKFSKGSIEFNKQSKVDPEAQAAIAETERITQERKEELDAATAADLIVKESQRANRAKAEFIFQEEIRFEEAGMSEEDRNKRLNVNTSFSKRNTETAYHRAVIYAQLKMEYQEAQRREKDTQIPSPAKQANALETQFEGGSGKMGSGTASLSSASGAVG